MQSELMLRRSMAIDKENFDLVRALWRKRMFAKAVKRDRLGRFAHG